MEILNLSGKAYWLKWVFVLFLCASAIVILLLVTSDNLLTALINNSDCEFKIPLLKNEISGLHLTKYNDATGKADFSIDFERLRIENNKLGPFKTALHKKVKLNDLQLKFFEYPCEFPTKQQTSVSSLPRISFNNLENLKSQIDWLKNQKRDWSVNLGTAGISEVYVNNFDYRIFRDNVLSLGIESKKALANYDNSYLTLRGHVKITAYNGDTLESNCVVWDIKNEVFNTAGIYTLKHNGKTITGKNIRVDSQLNVIESQLTKSIHKKEGEKCFAKLE